MATQMFEARLEKARLFVKLLVLAFSSVDHSVQGMLESKVADSGHATPLQATPHDSPVISCLLVCPQCTALLII
jgi:hypothetical protein